MLNISLDTLTVVRKSDRVGRDEPLLWTLFIEVSGATLNSHQFVVKTDPLAGKLAKAGEGDKVLIPPKAGRYTTRKDQLFLITALAIAFDNDRRSDQQILAGYAAAAAALNQGLIEQVVNILDEDTRQQAFDDIAEKITEAVTEAFLENGIVRAALGGEPVGSAYFVRGLLADQIDEPIQLAITRDADDPRLPFYKVQGRLRYRKPAVTLP